MDDQKYEEALNAATLAKERWTVEYERNVAENGNPNALAQAAMNAIETAEKARNVLERVNDHNRGWYPFVEALVFVLVYLIGSTFVCIKHYVNYSNMKKGHVVHGLYFVVVTAMTIGYGDISPSTKGSKKHTMILVLAAILISFMGNIVVDNIKSWLKKRCFTSVTGWKKEVLLVILSLLAVGMCIVVGMVGIFCIELKNSSDSKMDILNSFYLSIITLATVGYGDFSFKSNGGRWFAITWILICQPIFHESSKFFVSCLIRCWRYFVTVLLKRWFVHIWNELNNWRQWLQYIWGQLQWLLDHLRNNGLLLFWVLASLALASLY